MKTKRVNLIDDPEARKKIDNHLTNTFNNRGDFVNLQKAYDVSRKTEQTDVYNTDPNVKDVIISSDKDHAWEFFLYLAIGEAKATYYLATSFINGYGTIKDDSLAFLSMAIGVKLKDQKSIELVGDEPIPNDAKQLADKCVVQINKNAREVGSKKVTYEQAIGYGKLIDKILESNAKPTFADNIQEGSISFYADFVELVEPVQNLYPNLLGVGEDVHADVAALGQEDSSSNPCCCVIS
ncbi:hypothetical protein [Candidatus Tisiphia endosymbiont of Micropterix aruncella]|uniref:hypothetical protein n=1 Tax=Candidatus Tisiphia endosymbiont of Micropterix aruncella TaxID=3066271 RepID=UPI003AA97139